LTGRARRAVIDSNDERCTHLIESDPIEIASAEVASLATIAYASDIETLFRQTLEK